MLLKVRSKEKRKWGNTVIMLTQKVEYAALAYSLNLMQDSIKKMIKKRYKEQKKEMLASYRGIIERVNVALEQDKDNGELYLDNYDAQLLHDFLDAYLDKMHAMDLHKQKVAPEHRHNKAFVLEHIDVLDAYKTRLSEVAAAYA